MATGQGQVKDPETDGRLKENRGNSDSNNTTNSRSNNDDDSRSSRSQRNDDDSNNTQMGSSNDANIDGWTPGQVGAVQDPDNDGRLKENRMEGRTLGTTEHSAQAPHNARADDGNYDDDGSQSRSR